MTVRAMRDQNDGPELAKRGGIPGSPKPWSGGPGRSAASCSTGSAAGRRPGSAPGGKTGSWPATLDDPLVRVQLFRFIDALPALKDAGSVRRHLAEYLAEAGDAVPWWLDLALAAGARRLDPRRNGWPRRRGRRPA